MIPENSTKRNIHKANILFLCYISLASALGGFLWGFDAIVISGTITPVKNLFNLSPGMEGFFVSSGLIGAVMGSAIAGWLSDKYGRSRNLAIAAALMLVSAIGSALASRIDVLIFARWLGGLGIGISAMVSPLYISEISPAHLRGRLVTMFQFAVTIGIVAALCNNIFINNLAETMADKVADDSFLKWLLVDNSWRSMFACELIPGILFMVMAVTLPESPRWLVKTGQTESALKVLKRVLITGADIEFQEISDTIAKEQKTKVRFVDVFGIKYRKPLTIAVLLAVFAQFSGINVIFYYGPTLLERAGFNLGGALSGVAVIGVCNMIFTMIAVWLVDKLGRKALLQFGTIGAIACLIGIGSMFAEENPSNTLVILICSFVAFFSFSLGPIKFVFASEIFPTNIRSHAISVVILSMWLADTLVGQFFPILRDSVGPSLTFYIFGGILIPQILLVWKMMPETAGRSLEEIENSFNLYN